MIRLRYFDNRSLNPAWVKDINCVNNEVRIEMEGRDGHLPVPFSSRFKALAYGQHLKFQVETCHSDPSGEAVIYLKSFGDFRLDLLKIESIACPENDCCVLIKLVDEEIESRFPFHSKFEALRFAKCIEFLVDSCNLRQSWFTEDDKIESIACPENDCCVLIKLGHEEIETRFPFHSKSEALRFAKCIEFLVDSCNLRQSWFTENDSSGTDAWL